MLRVFTGSDAKADYYARVPPIVVFFGWASFVFTPWLVLFTSSDTIATEVASRSIRFAALRTGRLEFALGKLVGQVAVVVGVTGLMAVAFYVVAWARLSGFELGATALGLLSYWPRVIVYLLPFVAWALCASMITSSANVARLVALGGGVLLAILGGLAGSERLRAGPVSEALLDVAGYLTPFGHSEGLSFPPGGTLGVDLAALLALAVVYFAAGFAVLRRRDL
jgi:ABC-type transport system involved in multi-copper enzyme maturation permease subunit